MSYVCVYSPPQVYVLASLFVLVKLPTRSSDESLRLASRITPVIGVSLSTVTKIETKLKCRSAYFPKNFQEYLPP